MCIYIYIYIYDVSVLTLKKKSIIIIKKDRGHMLLNNNYKNLLTYTTKYNQTTTN